MMLRTLKEFLAREPDRRVRFILPDGDPIAPEAHVTEVGHVVKNFIDCGGIVRRAESCLLQVWVAGNDPGHRLTAGKLGRILDLAAGVVADDALEVEIEYEPCCVAQYRIGAAAPESGELRFALEHKHTDCLAREACGLAPTGCGCGDGQSACR